jgi:hypothetical protein
MYQSYFRTLRGVPEIQIHSIDYERIRMERDSGESEAAGANVVVLDQGWFSKPRPDFLDSSNYPPTNQASFSHAMCAYLDFLVETLEATVVVVCHPKADLEATRRLYPGIRVEQGDTHRFVRSASVVLANSTTAIQYAILEHKPVILFTSRELDDSIVFPLFEGYRREINPSVVRIDDDETYAESVSAIGVDQFAYDRYTIRFVKHMDSPDIPLWEIVFQGLSRIVEQHNSLRPMLSRIDRATGNVSKTTDG